MPTFEDVIPMAEHRVCVRHLWVNFRDERHRGVALKDKLWAASCAYTEAEFNAHMQELKRMSQAALSTWTTLIQVGGPEHGSTITLNVIFL
jgi:hypothetical protein